MRQFCVLHWEEIITKTHPICRFGFTDFVIIPPRNFVCVHYLRVFLYIYVPCTVPACLGMQTTKGSTDNSQTLSFREGVKNYILYMSAKGGESTSCPLKVGGQVRKNFRKNLVFFYGFLQLGPVTGIVYILGCVHRLIQHNFSCLFFIDLRFTWID